VSRRAEPARALIAAGLASAACRGGCADGEQRRAEASEAAAVSLDVEVTNDPIGVLHDCNGLEPSRPARCAHEVAPGDALAQGAERLTEIGAMHFAPENEWWDDLEAAVVAAEGVRPDVLTTSERVTIQNAALFLAVAASRDVQLHPVAVPVPRLDEERAKRDRNHLVGRAMALVKRLAFAPDARPASDDPDPALDSWLGPRALWVERTKEDGASFHQSLHDDTRLFRLVRTPAMRANFSQLIAVDARGEPFITQVVGSLETRRGFDVVSRACVALPSADLLRCNASAGLEAVRDLSALPHSHFFVRDAHGNLMCNSCHAQGAAFSETHDLSSDAAASDLAARRAALLARVRAELAPLWRAP
jgi:hypothetical protein